jgi:hypothetical protein
MPGTEKSERQTYIVPFAFSGSHLPLRFKFE